MYVSIDLDWALSQASDSQYITESVIYLQLFSVTHGINSTLAFYSVSSQAIFLDGYFSHQYHQIAILNAASTLGRLAGNYLAQIYGPLNVLVPCTVITAACIFAVFGV